MLYAGWDDFTLWVLEVDRIRWVGGFASMATVSHDEYRAAEPDPTAPVAAKSMAHLNKDHADGLLLIAREIAGARGAVSAVCTGIDRYGIDLSCTGAGQSRGGARALRTSRCRRPRTCARRPSRSCSARGRRRVPRADVSRGRWSRLATLAELAARQP